MTVISLGLSGAGLVALVITIRQGRESIQVARDANDEAIRQAATSGEGTAAALAVTRNAERAHITISNIGLMFEIINEEVYFVRWTWVAHNSGRTPGYILKVPLAYSFPEPFSEHQRIDHSAAKARIFIGPGKYIHWQIRQHESMLQITKEEFDKFVAGEASFYYYGHVEYEDVFGVSHESGFYYRVFSIGEETAAEPIPNGEFWHAT